MRTATRCCRLRRKTCRRAPTTSAASSASSTPAPRRPSRCVARPGAGIARRGRRGGAPAWGIVAGSPCARAAALTRACAAQLAAKNIPRFIAHFQDQVGPALNAVESVIDSGDEQLHDLGLSILAATASKVTRGADKVATCCCRLMLRELPEKDAALVRKALDAAVAAGPSDALSAVLEHCAVDPAGNEACLKIASRALSPRRVTRMRKEGTLAGVAASVLSLLRAPDLPTASFVPLFGAMSRVANSPGGGAPAPAKVAENGAAAGTADEPDVAAAPPAVSAADLVSLLTARVRPDAPFDPASEEDADRAVLAARLGVPLVRHHPEAAQPFAAFVLDKALPSAASLPTKAQEAVMRSVRRQQGFPALAWVLALTPSLLSPPAGVSCTGQEQGRHAPSHSAGDRGHHPRRLPAQRGAHAVLRCPPMPVQAYAYTHARTHTQIRTPVNTHTCVHTCIHTPSHVYTHTHAHSFIHTYTHTYVTYMHSARYAPGHTRSLTLDSPPPGRAGGCGQVVGGQAHSGL